MAARRGFEPLNHNVIVAFRVRCIQPLCHLSVFKIIFFFNDNSNNNEVYMVEHDKDQKIFFMIEDGFKAFLRYEITDGRINHPGARENFWSWCRQKSYG